MIRIAVCDDDKHAVLRLVDIIMGYSEKTGLEIETHTFFDGVELVSGKGSEMTFDMYFLDISMPIVNGIEAAKEIRKRDSRCKIVFVTSYDRFAYSSFSVRPANFISKPATEKKIEEELNAFVSALNTKIIEKPKQQVIFNGKYADEAFNIEDICYFEVVGKNIVEVVMLDKRTTIYCPLKEVFNRVYKHSFAKPHRSYIVGLAHVFNITKTGVIMDNGDSLPFAARKAAEFRKQFYECLHEILSESLSESTCESTCEILSESLSESTCESTSG